VLNCGKLGGGDGVVAHEERRQVLYVHGASEELETVVRVERHLTVVNIGCIGRHWLHWSTLVAPTPTPPLPPLRAAQLFREAIA
jgi:hypothetical protein